jgi:hypothetical protein
MHVCMLVCVTDVDGISKTRSVVCMYVCMYIYMCALVYTRTSYIYTCLHIKSSASTRGVFYHTWHNSDMYIHLHTLFSIQYSASTTWMPNQRGITVTCTYIYTHFFLYNTVQAQLECLITRHNSDPNIRRVVGVLLHAYMESSLLNRVDGKVCVCMYVCIYVCMCGCAYVCVYVCI